jgi:phytoene/squalene synthetase
MKALFDRVSAHCSKITTLQYSTSFSLGIRLLAPKFHPHIYAIYGFVRFADEIVDSFHDYNKAGLLEQFRKETYEAIESGISMNPILNSFQHTVHQYHIERALIDTFLDSMEMDLKQCAYTRELYEQYILGSAEVVGLMCLRVFCEGDDALYELLTKPAMKLGAAFQKINFLRDIQADREELGRSYFPGVNLNNFTQADKQSIEQELAKDFSLALAGIRQLPSSARRGVYLAYTYYRVLFRKIQSLPPQRILCERIRVANSQKLGLMFESLFRHQFNLL